MRAAGSARRSPGSPAAASRSASCPVRCSACSSPITQRFTGYAPRRPRRRLAVPRPDRRRRARATARSLFLAVIAAAGASSPPGLPCAPSITAARGARPPGTAASRPRRAHAGQRRRLRPAGQRGLRADLPHRARGALAPSTRSPRYRESVAGPVLVLAVPAGRARGRARHRLGHRAAARPHLGLPAVQLRDAARAAVRSSR